MILINGPYLVKTNCGILIMTFFQKTKQKVERDLQ